MSHPTEPSLVGRTLGGKYALESLLGRGAMGAVYRARHLLLDELVAVKVMRAELSADPLLIERFKREAKAAMRLDHRNTVRLFDFGQEEDGLLYLVMELLDGKDLGAVLAEEHPLGDARVASLIRQTLGALAAAHDAGIVHRDIKPENIMVLSGRDDEGEASDVVKVCDFGIAMLREKPPAARASHAPGAVSGAVRVPKLTQRGVVMGTPEYMSPEQGRGEPLDARSDLYAVGIVLFELLTGRVPFEGESPLAIVHMQISLEPEAPSSLVPIRVDPGLEAICMKALRKDPAERYQSAREMRAALRANDGDVRLSAVSIPHEVVELANRARRSTPARRSSATPARAATQNALHVDVEAPRASSIPASTAIDRGSPTVVVTARGATPEAWARKRGVLAVALAVLVLGGLALTRGTLRESAHAGGLASALASFDAISTLARADESPPRPDDGDELRASPAPTSKPPSSTASARRADGLKSGAPESSTSARAAASPVPVAVVAEPLAPSVAPTSSPPAPSPTSAPPIAPTDSPPSPAPPPAAPAFDPSSARVVVAGVSNEQAVLKRDVSQAIGRAVGRMTACYQASLRTAATPSSGRGALHVETDGNGTVVRARARASFASGLGPCIERAVLGLHVSGVDTGDASADVALAFELR